MCKRVFEDDISRLNQLVSVVYDLPVNSMMNILFACQEIPCTNYKNERVVKLSSSSLTKIKEVYSMHHIRKSIAVTEKASSHGRTRAPGQKGPRCMSH